MRYLALPAIAIALAACGDSGARGDRPGTSERSFSGDLVSVSHDMAEAGLGWVELVASGADDATLREAFLGYVAPTEGCQAIIRLWARFRDWDAEIFHGFILEALDRKATGAPLVDEDGHPTRLGHSRRLWSAAVADVDVLRNDLQALRGD